MIMIDNESIHLNLILKVLKLKSKHLIGVALKAYVISVSILIYKVGIDTKSEEMC
jgi:hypothetical protein